jgi:hypothetical protein
MARTFVAGAALAAGLAATAAFGADISGLGWGEFRLAMDSGAKPSDVTTQIAGNEISFSMKLDSLSANADGGKTEGAASMEGEFVVEQPRRLPMHSMRIELSGHIIKTEGTTANLVVKIGGVEKMVAWKADEVKSGVYTESVSAAVPDGLLPTPFPVTASVTVVRPKDKGAVLLSLESIKVTAAPSRVADFSWGTYRSDAAFAALMLAQ